MNKPKATRLGLGMALTLVAVVAAFVPSAFAAITPSASTVYGSDVPGAHGDYTIIQNFNYGNGAEPTPSTGAGQDLKKWIVDSPAGLVGNPNAIPQNLRCDPAAFDTTPAPLAAYNAFYPGSCPASSQVGTATVYTVNDADTPTPGCTPTVDPFACIPGGANMTPMQGVIYLLKTDPEVPTTLGTIFTSGAYQSYDFSGLTGPGSPACTVTLPVPCIIRPKTKSVLAPVTNRSAANNGDTDFRIRTVPSEYTNPPNAILPNTSGYTHAPFTPGNPSQTGTPVHIRRIDQKLNGMVDPNVTPGDSTDNVPFLTNPTRCDSWDSMSYAIAWNGGGGSLSMDPNHTGGVDSTYVKSNVDQKAPNCANKPPFNTGVAALLSTGERGAYPGLNIKVGDPNPSGHDQTKTMVTTLPEAVSVNVNALNNVCSEADRNADTCPAASKIGNASIKTPLITGGLTGRVYMVKGSTPGLPFISIYVDGAVNFRLDATTRFVGPNFNMIETTLTNLPQTPFTDFTVNIEGGNSNTSLLFNRSCPTDGSSPAYGSTQFALTGYLTPTGTSSSPNSFENCRGISNPSKISSCVKIGKQLKVSPKGVIDKAGVTKITLQTGSKSKNVKNRATDRKSPFKFKLTMKKSKYKSNKKYYYGYKVYYKDGNTIKTKTNTFKTCKR